MVHRLAGKVASMREHTIQNCITEYAYFCCSYFSYKQKKIREYVMFNKTEYF